MAYREFQYRWEYDLQARPDALWSFIADTNRFNRDAGLPDVERVSGEGFEGRRRMRFRRFRWLVEWDEQPFEWVRPQRFGVVRRYFAGPVAELRVRAELKEREAGGTKLLYEVAARPRNAVGLSLIPLQIGLFAARNFKRTIRAYDELAARAAAPLYERSDVKFAPGGRRRLEALSRKLAEEGADEMIVERLAQIIAEADDFWLARIRPHALADSWELPRREVLETFLRATRAGLLDLRWEMICPHCRGAAQTSASLSGLRSDARCESCNVDFTVNFDRSVEVTFHPNTAIRHVEPREFCVGGPELTPHIVAQQVVAPGESKIIVAPLEKGRYRVRASNVAGAQNLVAAEAGAESLTLAANENGWSGDEIEISLKPELTLANGTNREQIVMLERTAWSDQAATAAEVTTLQMFRDLFANEALRPGERISVGTLTIFFTDLKGSTKLYREIGDAPAFGRVMSHFDVLRSCIAEEGGALIKTIGDAVMASFRRPAAALRAALKAQELLAAPPDGMTPLQLKVGIHAGHAIAVTLNERLDYFGGTINAAARLEGISSGADVIISSVVRHDPEVSAWLDDPTHGYAAEKFCMQLKGFDEEQFELWRVKKQNEMMGAERESSDAS